MFHNLFSVWWQFRLWTPVFLRPSTDVLADLSLSAEQFWSSLGASSNRGSCSQSGCAPRLPPLHRSREGSTSLGLTALQNCSADKDHASDDALRKTGVHSWNCQHEKKETKKGLTHLFILQSEFEKILNNKIYTFLVVCIFLKKNKYKYVFNAFNVI